MKFVDLFAGLGGFRVALESLGHECVASSEIDGALRDLYDLNFPHGPPCEGDIREMKSRIPPHDILCGGFPCQPFSKAGAQVGIKDRVRGTLFWDILDILDQHQPQYVLLENVGNFPRHDNGRTWRVAKQALVELGYEVYATEHVSAGGVGLVSPHHLGFPHHRERFFIVGSRTRLTHNPFPQRTHADPSVRDVVQPWRELSESDREETTLRSDLVECIHHWNEFLAAVSDTCLVPRHPIWSSEIDSTEPTDDMPKWKATLTERNRTFWRTVADVLPSGWVERLREFKPSRRKLEWNCFGGEPDLWQHVLQFRPSGLRAKHYTTIPALVAMENQCPILGPERRYLTRTEGLRLQGLPDNFQLPEKRYLAFRALGNAVHAGVIAQIASLSFARG